MPRKVRELVDNGIYHVYNRGNNRKNLFEDCEDFQTYLAMLGVAKEKYEADIFHYCLMTNHYHFLMRVKKGESLGPLMHKVQLSYVRYYKKKYSYCGHVFQERYRSPRIHEESYYLQCGRYIERNPVKAGMVEESDEYPYSSASFYTTGQRDNLITANLYYADMGRSDDERQE